MNAPLIIFAYNRVDHLSETIKAVSKNYLAKETDVFVFSDGARNPQMEEPVMAVREYVRSVIDQNLFRSLTLKCSVENKGLAKSIIEGVTEIIDKYGRVIVIEDDVITSVDFLPFMNDCLNFYKDDDNVWSIGAYNVVGQPKDGKDVFIAQRICSSAWATWKDRWEKIDWEVRNYKKFRFNLLKRKRFNKFGNDRSVMLDEQQAGLNNSWAIRSCYSEFENNCFTVYPAIARVKNIGFDGSGENCLAPNSKLMTEISNCKIPYKLEHLSEPTSEVVLMFQNTYNSSFLYSTIRWVKALFRIKGGLLRKFK